MHQAHDCHRSTLSGNVRRYRQPGPRPGGEYRVPPSCVSGGEERRVTSISNRALPDRSKARCPQGKVDRDTLPERRMVLPPHRGFHDGMAGCGGTLAISSVAKKCCHWMCQGSRCSEKQRGAFLIRQEDTLPQRAGIPHDRPIPSDMCGSTCSRGSLPADLASSIVRERWLRSFVPREDPCRRRTRA